MLGTLAHHPALATGVPHLQRPHPLRHHARRPASASCWCCGSRRVRGAEYEWRQHVVARRRRRRSAPRRSSASPRARRRRAGRRSTRRWSRAVDELVADARITDATWAALAGRARRPAAAWTSCSPSAPTTCWRWRSAPSASQLDDDLPVAGNGLLTERDSCYRRRQRPDRRTHHGRTSPSPLRAAGPSTSGSTPRPVDYEDSISPEFYELEREAIFRKHLAQRRAGSSSCPATGSYFTKELDAARTSVIVVKDMDGEVRAFHNICRHRGNKLVWNDFPQRGDQRHLPPVHLQVPRLALRPRGRPHLRPAGGGVLRPRQGATTASCRCGARCGRGSSS